MNIDAAINARLISKTIVLPSSEEVCVEVVQVRE